MSQVFSTFAVLSRKESIDAQFRKLDYNAQQEYAHTVARMAESVDALVSNTSAARHAGSIPAPGTRKWPTDTCRPFLYKIFPTFSPHLTIILHQGH